MRLADEYLQCSVYIYTDEASATARKWAGGSGSLVHTEWMDGDKLSTADFVVANRHVLTKIVDRDTKSAQQIFICASVCLLFDIFRPSL